MLINNLKKEKAQETLNKQDLFKTEKHFPSAVREWNNSIYVFNSNTLKSIPYAEKIAMNIIKAYFSAYNKNVEKFLRTKKFLNRFRKYSSNKIYISKGEFKHTNNKVLINLYIYNRQKLNYISYMKNWYNRYLKKDLNLIFINRLKTINKKGLVTLEKANEKKISILKILNLKAKNTNSYKNVSNYIDNFYKLVINKSIKKIKTYFFYKQLLYTNKSLLNYNYLHVLKNYLELLYNKNVEFNLINLKRFYLNSDILSESVLLKITRDRRKLLKYLNLLKGKVKIYKKRAYLGEKIERKILNFKQNLNLVNNRLESIVLNNLKYKDTTGFRLEAKGRLTRRYTASRSISKVKYKGNLLDLDSSYRGLSTVLLKGNLKSNLQSTKLKSKTRIGSFGIKGWVSGN